MERNKAKDYPALDDDQKAYREYFGGITDAHLIQVDYDSDKVNPKDGYIIFIDKDLDIDYIDHRDWTNKADEHKEMMRHVAKLQLAEAVPVRHLTDHIRIEFKKILGAGYVHALNGNYNDIPEIIERADDYLQKRNREFSRQIFLSSGLPIASLGCFAGLLLYLANHYWGANELNAWFMGIVFGILGTFVSIWTRYGKENLSGMGSLWLHCLECGSRFTIGVCFALVAMIAIRCRLILPALEGNEEIFAFALASFIAAFSERFIPSMIEKLTNNNDDTEEE